MRERSHDGAPTAAKRGEKRGGKNGREMRNSWKECSEQKREEAPMKTTSLRHYRKQCLEMKDQITHHSAGDARNSLDSGKYVFKT